jgi:hypothetical protein
LAIWKSKLAPAIALLGGPFLIWHVLEQLSTFNGLLFIIWGT